MHIVFTDLDGTLLDHRTYSFDAARPALDLLANLAVPMVICTSKTRAEVEVWRRRLRNRHPFIVENGGALFVPDGYFALPFNVPSNRDGFRVVEFGNPYADLVAALRDASRESGCKIAGFHDMSIEEVSRRCGMPAAQAALAKQREYDEPFEILGSGSDRLLAAIEGRKKRWTQGGRFYHIFGANDKSHCVRLLIDYYRRAYGEIVSVGLGDGLNDRGFLNAVDIPVLLLSPKLAELQAAVPRGIPVPLPGPEGWNAAICSILGDRGSRLCSPIRPNWNRFKAAPPGHRFGPVHAVAP